MDLPHILVIQFPFVNLRLLGCFRGFLKSSTLNVSGWIILYCGGGGGSCPMHHRTFSSIPGLYPLDASVLPPPSCNYQNVSRHRFPGGNPLPLKTIDKLFHDFLSPDLAVF